MEFPLLSYCKITTFNSCSLSTCEFRSQIHFQAHFNCGHVAFAFMFENQMRSFKPWKQHIQSSHYAATISQICL